MEHDAEAVWWTDFTAIVADLLRAAGGRPLAGLEVSGIGPCLLPAGEHGDPLRPAILYGVDTRAGAEIASLNEELGAGEILARGGSPLTSQAVGPKVRWPARHEPDVHARTEKLLMASSFLVHRLTGRYVLDHHSASQCTPLYDLAAGEWAKDWAEATSVGVREPGDVMVMYGTTMVLVQVFTEPRPHPGLWGTRGVTPDSFTLAAGMATSGAVTDWLRRLVGGDYADLVAEAAEVPAGSRGLLLLPHFAGERTPLFDPDARGVLAGLTTTHGWSRSAAAPRRAVDARRLGRHGAAPADPGRDDRRLPGRRAPGGGGDRRRDRPGPRQPDRDDGDAGPGECHAVPGVLRALPRAARRDGEDGALPGGPATRGCYSGGGNRRTAGPCQRCRSTRPR